MVERKVTIVSCLYVMAVASSSVLCSLEKRKFDRLIPPSFCTSTTCPPQKNYKPRQQLCSFSCPDGLFYKCLENGEEEHVIEFCAPSLECEPGKKGVFTIDSNDPTKVVMTVEPCPSGRYQRYNSDCINACTSKRDDFTFLTEGFVLFSNGSNILPPEVYCNYTDGYYNPNNITLFDFDDEFKYHFGTYCEHVSEKDPCEKGFMPLPNGSCVLPCTGGEKRDEHDDFICKHPSDESIIETQTTLRTNLTEKNQTTENPNQSMPDVSSDLLVVVIIMIVGGFFLIAVGVIIACFCVRKRRKRERKDKTPNGDIEEHVPLKERNQDDGSDKKADDINETHYHVEKSNGRSLENGIHKQSAKAGDENIVKESPETERKGNATNGTQKECINNVEQNGTIKNNYNSTNGVNAAPGQADPINAMQNNAENVAGPKAGELKKSHNDTLTPSRWNALNTQPESVGCLISDGNVAGTAFRVGTMFMMTAFHVISQIIKKDPNGTDNADNFDWQRLTCDTVYANFNESVTDKPKILSKVFCVFYNVVLDVAVLKFDVISDLPRKMILDTLGYLKPEKVHIIGFGNPENHWKKHIDPSCRVISANSPEIKNAHAWLKGKSVYYRDKLADPNVVDAGYYGYDDLHKIILNCYLEHGASGGPLLTVDNKRCVQVIGILTHGMPEFYFHLSPQDQRAFPTEYRFEYGTRMKDIYNAIRETNPDLAKDIFGEQ